MAKAARKGSHIVLDDVRVSYDYKTDTVSLTSGDRDLTGAGGLVLHLPRGSNEERTLRNLLKSKGVLRGDPWPVRSTGERIDGVLDAEERKLVIGTNINGVPVTVDLAKNSSLWIHGGVGSGTTVVERSAVAHAVVHGWEIYGLDATGVELRSYKGYPTSKTFSTGLKDSLALADSLHSLILERYEKLEHLQLNHYLSMNEANRWKPALVVVDSLATFLNQEAMESPESNSKFADTLTQLARLGRAAGVYLVIRGGGATPSGLDELAISSAHVVTGNYPKDSLPTAVASSYAPGRGRGRKQAHVFSNFVGFNGEIETIFIPQEQLDLIAEQMK